MTYTYIGVDLSKAWLDIYHPAQGHQRVANTAPDITCWLARLGAEELVVFEATSLCDSTLLRLASAAGQPFCRVNPLHGWHFAQSLNLPKTDRIDARMLARLGAERRLRPHLPQDAARAELAELVGRRDQLTRLQTQEKNRLHKTRSAAVRDDITAQLDLLSRRIAQIERAIRAFLVDHPELAAQQHLLRSLPGVGAVTATTLLAHMPELGHLDRRAIASLGGLAPKARESGQWRAKRAIGDGRRHIRRALFMAALSAMRTGRFYPKFIADMRARGKSGKLIAIAIARKLLVTANALLRTKTTYQIA